MTDKAQATFTIPFTQVQNKVIDSNEFRNPIDKLVYISLLRFAFNRGESFPSIKKLADMNISSENTIRKSLKRLEKMELITIEKRNSDSGSLSNLYKIHDLKPHVNENAGGSKIEGGASKSEGEGVQKLKEGASKSEPEEEVFNKNKYLRRSINKNQSINEGIIQQSDLHISIQKELIMNIDRMKDDSIYLIDIEEVYKAYQERLTDYEFSLILGKVLSSTRGKIKNIKSIMMTAINNHIKELESNKSESINNEVVPEWFKEMKENEKKDKYKGYDFTKNRDWLKDLE